MSEDVAWDLSQLASRVRRIEGWMAQVQGKREAAKPVLSPVVEAVATARAAGVSEDRIAEARTEFADDPPGLLEALEELAEEDTLRGRMRRGGIPLDPEERKS